MTSQVAHSTSLSVQLTDFSGFPCFQGFGLVRTWHNPTRSVSDVPSYPKDPHTLRVHGSSEGSEPVQNLRFCESHVFDLCYHYARVKMMLLRNIIFCTLAFLLFSCYLLLMARTDPLQGSWPPLSGRRAGTCSSSKYLR